MSNLDLQKLVNLSVHKPEVLQEVVLTYLEENLGDTLRLVDPTNPYVLLLESMVAVGAATVDHNLLNLSKRYAVLCENEEELYPHLNLGDTDLAYALPASGEFTVRLNYDVLYEKALLSEDGLYRYVSIPKDTIVTADGVPFAFSHEVQLRLYGESLKVIIVPSDDTDILPVTSNVVSYRYIQDADRYRWILFNIPLVQLTKTVKLYECSISTNFSASVTLEDDFYLIKAYHKVGGTWVSLPTNHTLEVFDPLTPMLSVKVINGSVKLFLIPSYVSEGLMGSELKVIIYSTTGAMVKDFSGVELADFKTTLTNLDAPLNIYDKAFNSTSFQIYTGNTISGGRDQLSFAALKYRHLLNSYGTPNLPVSELNLKVAAANTGNRISRYRNTVDGRIFLTSSGQPLLSSAPYYTELSVGYSTLTSSFESLAARSTTRQSADGTRLTLPPSLVYQVDQLKATLVEDSTLTEWASLSTSNRVTAINANDYRYVPWFYVLEEEGSALVSRAYELDQPVFTDLSFSEHNVTTGLYLNSASLSIQMDSNTYGHYLVQVELADDPTLAGISLSELYVQLTYLDPAGTRYHIGSNNATETDDGKILIEFTLETDLDLIASGYLGITNSKTLTGEVERSYLALEGPVSLIFCTTTLTNPGAYSPGPLDLITMQEDVVSDYYPVTEETTTLRLGEELTGLWADIRPTIANVTAYYQAEEDIPLRYTQPVLKLFDNGNGVKIPFQIGEDCTVSSTVYHATGDIVYDGDNIVYQYLKGDYLLDDRGQLIPKAITASSHHFSFMSLPYSAYCVTEANAVKDRNAVLKNIVYESTTKLDSFSKTLLAHTDAYYKPSVGMGPIKIQTAVDTYDWLEAQITGTIILRCEETIYESEAVQLLLKQRTFDALGSYLKNSTIDRLDLASTLLASYDEGVTSVSLDLSLFETYDTFKVVENSERLTVQKVLHSDSYGDLSLREAITFKFINFSKG